MLGLKDEEKFINAVVDYIKRVAIEFTKIKLGSIKEHRPL